MSNKPPQVVIPGLSRGGGVPAGYILGRPQGTGRGPVQLLDLAQLRKLGVKTAGSGVWGSITGTIASQADLQAALDGKLSVFDNSINWGVGALTTDATVTSLNIGDITQSGTFTCFAGFTLGSMGGFEFDLKNAVGGVFLGGVPRHNRAPLTRYGTITGWEFDADPYVNTSKIYHEGNLSFGAGLNYSGGVLTASSLSSAISTVDSNQSTSLSQISSSLSGAISSTSSLSTAVSSVDSGQAASLSQIKTASGSLKLPVSTVAGLPSAATEGAGALRAVSDALAPTLGVIIAGGGSVYTIVLSDGTNWIAN